MTWKDVSRGLKQQVADFLDLPGDIMLNLPKVSLLGNLQMVVENHRGILKFSPEAIHISINGGELIISGRELRLRSVFAEEIYVEGEIKSICFEGDFKNLPDRFHR